MSKIFVIGSNKTGTTSLKESLSILGFNVCPEYCYHPDSKILNNFQDGLYQDLFDMVDKFDAFEDRPWNHTDFYQILNNKYPNSKLINELAPLPPDKELFIYCSE